MNGNQHRHQEERVAELIAREAARFIASEAGTDSLITVIRAEPSTNGERISVYVSIFPAEKARSALAFLDRQREAFSDYLKKHTERLRLPRVEFLLDNSAESALPIS